MSAIPAIAVVNEFTNVIPVDLDAIAGRLGIKVVIQNSVPDTFSGSILREARSGRDTFTITLNGNHSPNRRRFTLAHEIAHFILHSDDLISGITDNEMYRSGLPDYKEFEANRFAGELLMPTPLVRVAWKAGARAIAPLAHAFGVSDEAMRIRLKQLGFAP